MVIKMMKMSKLLFLIMTVMMFSACSKKESGTPAKFKLTLSGITNFTNGIGSGGAILFGKSSNGQQFGKVLSSAEENLELANGQWTFYAVMWNKVAGNFDSTPSCAKTSVQLSGTAVSIPLNLKNANCADNDFSGGNHYTYIDKIKFSDFYLEECDELNKASSYTCLAKNQGSALSYRLSFRSFEKSSPTSMPVFSTEVIHSKCLDYQTMHAQGNKVNFPTGTSAMAFVISAEMFLGTNDCGANQLETKGIYQYVFKKGLAAESSLENTLVRSPANSCSFAPATNEQCEDNLGTWSGSYCTSIPTTILAFTPFVPGDCGGYPPYDNSYKYIKQMVSIPKNFLCRNNNYSLTGAEVFPGGEGSTVRPYKICNEWQINQIGERHASSDNLASKHYKLMNDLDMNITDFTPTLRPSCVGVAGSILKNHHNFNPLSQLTRIGCGVGSSSLTDFTGTFNGNKKTISHARIVTEGVDEVGMVRNLETNASITDLTFKHYEVRGKSRVGGIAGHTEAWSKIMRVNLEDTNIEGEDDNIGGVVGQAAQNATMIEVRNTDASIYGFKNTGGLIGRSDGSIINSMFRGEIKQHQDQVAGIGGLVGQTDSNSFIASSFSEGMINATAKYVGGVVGINTGNINASYSNMYLQGNYPTAGSALGGIVGYHISGNIYSVYSDSILLSANATIDGIVGIVGSGTFGDCFSINPVPSTTASCSNPPSLRNGIGFAGSGWKTDMPGVLPRLDWEHASSSRVCLLSINLASVSTQKAAGRGAFMNPIVICKAQQLTELSGSLSDVYVKLGEDISLATWTDADVISTFGGHLNGQGYALYGLNILASTLNTGLAIFKNNTGSLTHLSLMANIIEHNDLNPTGMLTGVNSGNISHIEFHGNSLKGQNYVGQVAGSNSGTIDQVYINQGSSIGGSYVGGVAGENTGSISRASAQLSMNSGGSSNYLKFGGIAGSNYGSGVIDQVIFSGNISFPVATTVVNLEPFVGGLVGFNNGVVKNGLTKNYTQISVMNAGTVGGLIGYNGAAGRLETSIGLGSVIFNNGGSVVPGASTFGPTVGFAAGGSVESSVFYLQYKTGAMIGTGQVDYCSGTQANFFPSATMLTSYSAPDADMMMPTSLGGNGDNLNSLYYFGPTIPAPYQVPFPESCTASSYFDFYKSYEPNITGRRSVAQIGSISTYASFNMAFDSGNPATSLKLAELYDFFESEMYGRAPRLVPPIWEFENGRQYPRLLQVND